MGGPLPNGVAKRGTGQERAKAEEERKKRERSKACFGFGRVPFGAEVGFDPKKKTKKIQKVNSSVVITLSIETKRI